MVSDVQVPQRVTDLVKKGQNEMNRTTGRMQGGTTNYIYVNPEASAFMGKQKRINGGVGIMLTLGVAFAAMTIKLMAEQQRQIDRLKRGE